MQSKTTDRIIMGIDPGTNIMGYGIIKVKGKDVQLITLGFFDLHNIKDHYLTLKEIHRQTTALIEKYLPDEMAIEAPFFFFFFQSMLKLGRAQGVAITAALLHDIPVTEYAPLKIKMSITGNGSASKEQVSSMLKKILGIPTEEIPIHLDATDGLAAAYCHYLQTSRPQIEKKYSSWKEYALRNPDKIK